MNFLSGLSIKWKLLLIIMLSSATALVLACAAFIAYDQHSTKEAMGRKLEVLAGVIADNAVSSLVFDDAQAAAETLSALQAEPHIVAAAIYDAGGAAFTHYHRDNRPFTAPPPAAAGPHFGASRLEVFLPIALDGGPVGTVYIHSDLRELDDRLERYLGIGGLFFITACLVSALVAVLLQRLVSAPIDHLAAVARAVTSRHDYTVRAAQGGQDELGELATGFNEMLAEIQIRDADLEDQVQRRTSELLKAKETAEAANRAKSTFLVHMSRELRTPVSSIIGMAELTLEQDVSPDQRGYQEAVREAAGNLLALFDNLMDLSHLETGQLQLQHESFSLREALTAPLKGLALRAHGKDLELALRIPPETPDAVIGDARRLRQIVVNLVGNAIKFTSFGEVLFDIETSQDAPGQLRLHGSVSDTGIGIAAEKQQAIFAPFAQADPEIARQYGGTGLGLAICRDLLAMMEGRISVESQPDRGSTFRFDLSLQLDPVPTLHNAPSPELSDRTALVVDDNTTSRRIVQQQLSAWGLQVDTSFSGRDALQKLEAAHAEGQPFALLVLDTVMAGMDPYELVGRLREDGRFAALPIIALAPTTSARPDDTSPTADFAAYLLKPASQTELLAATCAALSVEWSETTVDAEVVRPLRVLLAEDTPANQRFTTALLEKRGHSALVVKNGREALAALERESFDLILMDIQMPEMSGLEATERIRARQRPSGQHTPILALTAYALEEDEERCLAAGMNGYLAKPFNERQLFAAIGRILPTTASPPPPTALEGAFPALLERLWIAVADKDGAALEQVAMALGPLVVEHAELRQNAERLGNLGREGLWDEAGGLGATLERQVGELLRRSG